LIERADQHLQGFLVAAHQQRIQPHERSLCPGRERVK
jgi:hypothetical protein